MFEKMLSYKSSMLNSLADGSFVGILTDLPNRVYHSLSGYVSSTNLKNMYKKTPKHYKHELDNPSFKQTDSLTLGSAFHCLLLTPSLYEEEFFVLPKYDGRTKEGKALKAALEVEASTKTVIDIEASDVARAMSDAVWKHRKSSKVLSGSTNEVSFFWRCPYSALMMKARVDALQKDFFIEVKSSLSCNPSDFSRQAFNLHYDLSLVHYRQAISILLGVELPAKFIVTENTAPHDTILVEDLDLWFETGHPKWLDAVNKIYTGRQKDFWPGYDSGEDVLRVDPPSWAVPKDKSVGEEMGNDV